jgi:hypothetical protein
MVEDEVIAFQLEQLLTPAITTQENSVDRKVLRSLKNSSVRYHFWRNVTKLIAKGK